MSASPLLLWVGDFTGELADSCGRVIRRIKPQGIAEWSRLDPQWLKGRRGLVICKQPPEASQKAALCDAGWQCLQVNPTSAGGCFVVVRHDHSPVVCRHLSASGLAAYLRERWEDLKGPVPCEGLCRLKGRSLAMRHLYQRIRKVAPTDATVFLIGESGSGKELVAEALHELSDRREAAYVAVNCGAIAPELIESELFGHEKGSFTHASRSHRGFFQQADGGTLLLDEVTEMPVDTQVKLLRVLETGRFHRVGGEQSVQVDVRIVAATNRQPEQAVAQGVLREDLYYRLAQFPMTVPSLQDRDDDVVLLAQHFAHSLGEGQAKPLTEEAIVALCRYRWPGNVRELRNVLERAMILAESEIRESDLQLSEPLVEPSGETVEIPIGSSLREAERLLIEATLCHCGGDKRNAAELLGVSLKTLYNRLNSYRTGAAA